MTKPVGEVARWFGAVEAADGANFGEEVYPGTPGLVVADGAVRAMAWGFPLARKGAQGQALKPKPVNNARADKLDTAFWRDSVFRRRCLIPLTAWAEAEGERGGMTRTWLTRPDAELFAAAGIWRMSAEWGAVYSMVMTDSCGAAAECHTRMPVLLADGDWVRWTEGDFETALALCVPYAGVIALDRTQEPWAGEKVKTPAPAPEQPLLL